MISMQDYMNNIKNKTDINQNAYKKSNSLNDKSFTTSSVASLNLNSKTDSFEKEDNKVDTSNDKKIDKKKIFKIGAIIAGIGLAILAFLKRKQISSALSNLFNKKQPPESPTPPAGNISNPKTPPAAPSSTPTIKPVQTSEPTIQGGSKAQPDVKINPTDDTSKTVQKGINVATTKSTQESLHKEYDNLYKKWESLSDDDPEKVDLGHKLYVLRNRMKDVDTSVISGDLLSSLSDEELKKYFIKIMNQSIDDKTTMLEFLEQFNKYGSRSIGNKESSVYTLSKISDLISNYINKCEDNSESINDVLQKYISVFAKYARKPDFNLDIYCDSCVLQEIYNKHKDVMTKDTVIKFINAFKNIAVDKQEYKNIKYFLKDGSWQIFYPKLKVEDLPDIQKALDEFAAAVENLPDDIMKV